MTKLLSAYVTITLAGLAFAAAAAPLSLHKAAHRGDIKAVRAILKTKIDPDARDSFGGTALHAAMFQDKLEIVRLLIEAGLDVNAQGTSNGYTPLHDAVWADNIPAAKILLKHGARTDIRGRDGDTPYEKALKENKPKMAALLKRAAANKEPKVYSPAARNNYSENDIKSFVYHWFAGFDHQAERGYFTQHLPAGKLDMEYPGFPIRTRADFRRWYQEVVDNIQENSHELRNLKVRGNEKDGFEVGLDVRWRARTYKGETQDMVVHQDWRVTSGPGRKLLITWMRARVKR